jgi:hypothetical protein
MTEGAIKNGQSRDTGNIGQTRHKMKTNKTTYTTQYVLHVVIRKQQTNINNVNKTRALLQITGGKDEHK